MKQIKTITLCMVLMGAPAMAQEKDGDVGEGMDLLSEGTRLLLRGLMGEIEPAIRELQDSLQDLNAYLPPEVLPNGDIIIRRKVPLVVEPEIGKDGEVDL